MSDHDQLFKTLIRRFFGDLMRIVVPDMARELRLDRVEFLESEMFTDVPEGDRRQLDVVAEVQTANEEIELVVVHVEVEARARGRSMEERMWRYAMQLRLRRGRPVVPLVVYLTGGEPNVHEVTVEDRFAGRRLASFSYSTFALGSSEAARYLERPETLAPALAALMELGELSPARHKLECLRRIARAEIDDAGRFLLVNCVETYIQWDDTAEEEYEALLAEEENREVTTMEMTWADKMQLKGMKNLVTGMIETRFGEVPDERKQRIEAIDSTEELTRLADRLLVARSLDDLGL